MTRSHDSRVSWSLVLALTVGAAAGTVSVLVPPAFALASVGIVVWLVLVAHRAAIALGVWILLVTNTVPFINVDELSIPGTLRSADVILILLVLGSIVLLLSGRPWLPLRRATKVATALLCVIWLLVFARSWLTQGVPPLMAALYGRDFLFMAITLVFARLYVSESQGERRTSLAVAVGGASVYAIAQIAFQLVDLRLSWILHPYMESSVSGLVRPYQWSVTLVWLLVAPCLVLGLSDGIRSRRIWLGVGVLLAVATLMAQTRAAYVGLTIAALVALFVLVQRSSAHTLRRLYGLIVVVVLAAMMGLLVMSPWLQTPVTVVTDRLTSIVGVFGGDEGETLNWVARNEVAADMMDILDGDWPWGLGFLHPSVRPVNGLPFGSIRNTDLGMMQVLMTMGLAGVGALLSVVVVTAWPALRDALRRRAASVVPASVSFDAALQLGLVSSIAGALAASVTLGMFIDAPAAMTTGYMLALLACIGCTGGRVSYGRSYDAD